MQPAPRVTPLSVCFYERKPAVSAHRAVGKADPARRAAQAALLTFHKEELVESMITLQINGKQVELEKPTPLLDYLGQLGVNPRAVAVEHNGEILERSAYADTTLREADRVEIVRMVGGGSTSAP